MVQEVFGFVKRNRQALLMKVSWWQRCVTPVSHRHIRRACNDKIIDDVTMDSLRVKDGCRGRNLNCRPRFQGRTRSHLSYSLERENSVALSREVPIYGDNNRTRFWRVKNYLFSNSGIHSAFVQVLYASRSHALASSILSNDRVMSKGGKQA